MHSHQFLRWDQWFCVALGIKPIPCVCVNKILAKTQTHNLSRPSFVQHFQEYENTLEDADEKVQLANQIYEMVRNNFVKLNNALFKVELYWNESENSFIFVAT